MDTDAGREHGTVLIAGATGLVGSHCVRAFAAHPAFGRVVALVRRPLPESLRVPGVTERIVDFERLDDARDAFAVTHVLCALGTTIRQAGSREAFRRVDHDYALAVARLGAEAGARQLLLVSAMGAAAGSRVFYNRVKGEVEEAVRQLPYAGITIARPSLLTGERGTRRLGETLARPVLSLLPARFKPVSARAVARALLYEAVQERTGVRIVESATIRRLGE